MLTDREIINQIYEINAYYSKKNLTNKYSKRFITKLFNQKLIDYILDREKVIVFTVAAKYKDCPDDICLGVIAVRPSHLHRGYGKKALKAFCKKFKGKDILLNVNAINIKAINFYKRNGFKIAWKKSEMLFLKKRTFRLKRTTCPDGTVVFKPAS